MKKITTLFLLFYTLNVSAQSPYSTSYIPDDVHVGAGNAWMPYGISSSYSHDWYTNMEKFWYYRYRLINDFMKIGDNAGESLPAISRDRGDNNGNAGSTEDVYRFWQQHAYRNCLDFGPDNTISLGNYLSTLACEYKLLYDNGLSTTRTEYEIQHAQNALKRLCNNAYYYESNAPSGGLSAYPGYNTSLCTTCSGYDQGYFLRDDVPILTFTDPGYNPSNYKHFNRPGLVNTAPSLTSVCSTAVISNIGTNPIFSVNKAIGAFKQSYYGPDPRGGAAIPSFSSSTPIHPISESQDQLVELWTGEALLSKFLNPSYSYSLKQDADEAIYKLTDWPRHLMGGPLGVRPYYGIPTIVNNWQCSNYSCQSSGLFFFSAPPATIATNRLLLTTTTSYYWPSMGNRVLVDAILAYPIIFEEMQYPYLSCHASAYGGGINNRDIAFVDNYVAFSKAYTLTVPLLGTGSFLGSLAGLAAGASPPTMAALGFFAAFNYASYVGHVLAGVRSWNTLKKHAADDFFGSPHIPLLYEINYGVPSGGWSQNTDVENLLNIAPPCGIWNYENACKVVGSPTAGDDYWNTTGQAYPSATGNSGHYSTGTFPFEHVHAGGNIPEWSGDNRLSEPYRRQGNWCYQANLDNSHFATEFNGLDYMYLFSLYSAEGQVNGHRYLQGIINPYYCENYDVNYPDNNGIGNTTHKLKLNWLEYLSAKNKVHASGNGWVEYRAAKVIDLVPGNYGSLGFEAEHGSFFNAYIKDYDCHGNESGNDGQYHFATVNVPGASYRTAPNNNDTIKELNTQSIPIVYIPNGKPPSPEIVRQDDINPSDDIYYDSLERDTSFMIGVKDYLKCLIINTTTDTEMLNFFIERYKWTPEEIALCKGQITEDIKVSLLPNPATESAYICYEIMKKYPVDIKLTNTLGQDFSALIGNYETNQEPGRYKIPINVENLVPGMYFVGIKIGSHLFNQKLVKL